MACGHEKERDDIQRCNECNRKLREWRLKREYRITQAEYEEMRASQGQKFALCHKPLNEGGRDVHVDHDHASGRARGILCMLCNVWLGRYEQFKALGLIDKFEAYLGRTLPGLQTT